MYVNQIIKIPTSSDLHCKTSWFCSTHRPVCWAAVDCICVYPRGNVSKCTCAGHLGVPSCSVPPSVDSWWSNLLRLTSWAWHTFLIAILLFAFLFLLVPVFVAYFHLQPHCCAHLALLFCAKIKLLSMFWSRLVFFVLQLSLCALSGLIQNKSSLKLFSPPRPSCMCVSVRVQVRY